MKKSYKYLLILLICLLLVTGCKKKKQEDPTPQPDPTPVSDYKETYPEITNYSEYMQRLNYFAADAYTKGFCTEEHLFELDKNQCELSLADMKKFLSDLDLTILESYKGKKCNPEKVKSFIYMDAAKEGNMRFDVVVDGDCMNLAEELPPKTPNDKKTEE